MLGRDHTRFVDQDRFGGSDTAAGERGNCFQTCLAALLNLPVHEVPHFMDTDETPVQQHAATARWLAARGWVIVYITPDWLTCEWFALGSTTLLMASGASPRGPWSHVVLGRVTGDGFQLVHDPHPSKAGIVGEPTGYYLVAATPYLLTPRVAR